MSSFNLYNKSTDIKLWNLNILLLVLLLIILLGCSSKIDINTNPKYNSIIGKTDNSDSVNSFILVGDSQKTGWMEQYFLFRESNDSVQFKIFDKIALLNPEFIIHLGDMVYEGSSDEDWKYFDDFTSEIRTMDIPLLPLLGNHEYMGDNDIMLEQVSQRFSVLKDSSWRAFVFNRIGFILLNSNSELPESMIDKQKKWYEYQMNIFERAKNIKYIVVATHHPPFTNGAGIGFGDSEYIKEDFVPIFKNSNKAKLFFSGHCHSYEHLLIDGKHFVISGGGGGPRRCIDLDGEYNDVTEGIEKDKEEREFNFVEVTVINGSLRLKTHIYNKECGTWDIGDEFSFEN